MLVGALIAGALAREFVADLPKCSLEFLDDGNVLVLGHQFGNLMRGDVR